MYNIYIKERKEVITMMNRVTRWQDASISDRLNVYDCYRANPGDDMDFEEFNAAWRNYTFNYVKSLFPAD